MSNLAEKRDMDFDVKSTPVVVGINNDSASVKILNYLEEKKRKSESTYEAYSRYYTEFFRFACNKKINEVTWEDILNVTYNKVDEYKNYLLNTGVKAYYVNQKLFACKSLWDKLYHFKRNEIDMRVWDFEEEDCEKNTYAALNDKEMELLFEFCSEQKHKPLTRRRFFEFLYYVGCRKNVALELKWDDFLQKYDSASGLDVWVIKFKDKGKWVEKAINNDFYSRLMEFKESESTGLKVFDLNHHTLEGTFNDFRAKYNLEMKNGKRVTIHSIKKASGWLVQNTFGDLNKTRIHLQHENPNTTANIYINVENYTDQASYMIGKEIEMDFFKELDKDVLVGLIEKCGKDVQMRLYYEYQKLNK
jgi:integrase